MNSGARRVSSALPGPSPQGRLAALFACVALVVVVILLWPQPGSLVDGFLPPLSIGANGERFLLGTDDLGRDFVGLLVRAFCLSLAISVAAVLLGSCLGFSLGLAAGLSPPKVKAAIFLLADLLQGLPATILAILLAAIMLTLNDGRMENVETVATVVLAIGISMSAEFVRPIATLSGPAHHAAFYDNARLTGIPLHRAIFTFAAPNALPQALAIMANGIVSAISIEASLSFIGIGLSQDAPGLGYLIRTGFPFLYSGQWWFILWPFVLLSLEIVGIRALVARMQRRLATFGRTSGGAS